LSIYEGSYAATELQVALCILLTFSVDLLYFIG